MKKFSIVLAILVFGCLLFETTRAFTHSQMIIPTTNNVTQSGKRSVQLDIRFSNPFEGQMMNMEKPSI